MNNNINIFSTSLEDLKEIENYYNTIGYEQTSLYPLKAIIGKKEFKQIYRLELTKITKQIIHKDKDLHRLFTKDIIKNV